jgi:hypothetical protein
LVAEREGELLGMIDVRDSSHASPFFVESGERGHGVGGGHSPPPGVWSEIAEHIADIVRIGETRIRRRSGDAP